MDVTSAALLLKELLAVGFDLGHRIQRALAERKEVVDLSDLGSRFNDVNARIQAARGPQGDVN